MPSPRTARPSPPSSPDGRVQVLETKDGTRAVHHQDDRRMCHGVAFSPDSSTLLTGAGFTDSTIRLWDAHSGKASGSLEGHRSWVSDLLFTPDGKRLISSSGDQTIRLWDWATRKPAGVLRGHLGEIDGLAMAPDGRTLASHCKDGSIYLWDLTKPSRHLGYQTFPSRLEYRASCSRPTASPSWSLEVERWGGLFGTLSPSRRRGVCGAIPPINRTSSSPRTPDGCCRRCRGPPPRLGCAQRVGDHQLHGCSGQFRRVDSRTTGSSWLTLCGPVTNLFLRLWDTDTWQRKGSFPSTSRTSGHIYDLTAELFRDLDQIGLYSSLM